MTEVETTSDAKPAKPKHGIPFTPTLTLEEVRRRNQRYQNLWAPTRFLVIEKARRGAPQV